MSTRALIVGALFGVLLNSLYPARDALALTNCSTPSANWGLLYNSYSPIKGAYFFPGDGKNYYNYTFTPGNSDLNSFSTNSTSIISQIGQSGANTLFMSYWGDCADSGACAKDTNISPFSPMSTIWPDSYTATYFGIFQYQSNIQSYTSFDMIPAIEAYTTYGDVEQPALSFPNDVSWLKERIEALITNYDDVTWWTPVVDRTGQPRTAFYLLHMWSYANSSGAAFWEGLDALAEEIYEDTGGQVGFFIDPYPEYAPDGYNPTAASYDALFSCSSNPNGSPPVSLLGIAPFLSEIVNGNDPQDGSHLNSCSAGAEYSCTDQNLSTGGEPLEAMAQWKREWVNGWVDSGVPFILDVAPGYDAHYVFPYKEGNYVGIFGDNSQDQSVDAWRNFEGQYRRTYPNGATLKGVLYQSYNGFTEGMIGVPAYPDPSVGNEPSSTIMDSQFNFFNQSFVADPRWCDYQKFAYGGAEQYHVQGAICDKWQCAGASFGGFGQPTSSEITTNLGNKKNYFSGGAIYFGETAPTGAHAVYGIILQTYESLGEDSSECGLPVSDEEDLNLGADAGRANYFQHGFLFWKQGDTAAENYCYGSANTDQGQPPCSY